MTKDEALRLALDALQQIAHVSAMDYEYQQWAVEAITAIKEALAQPEPNYKKALEVWLDKTEWVQETVKPHELGMHRADVLKQRIEEASPQRTWEKFCDSNCVWTDHHPDCKLAQRTWVDLTNKEVDTIRANALTKEWAILMAQSTLKEKNNG